MAVGLVRLSRLEGTLRFADHTTSSKCIRDPEASHSKVLFSLNWSKRRTVMLTVNLMRYTSMRQHDLPNYPRSGTVANTGFKSFRLDFSPVTTGITAGSMIEHEFNWDWERARRHVDMHHCA